MSRAVKRRSVQLTLVDAWIAVTLAAVAIGIIRQGLVSVSSAWTLAGGLMLALAFCLPLRRVGLRSDQRVSITRDVYVLLFSAAIATLTYVASFRPATWGLFLSASIAGEWIGPYQTVYRPLVSVWPEVVGDEAIRSGCTDIEAFFVVEAISNGPPADDSIGFEFD